MATAKQRVLFLCADNSVRSQMAEGLLRQRAEDQFEVFSAGMEAAPVRQEAIDVMAEQHIALEQHSSKTVEQFLPQRFDYVITVSGQPGEPFPHLSGGRKHLDWAFPDPPPAAGDEDARLRVFRSIRDAIDSRLDRFLNTRRKPVVSGEAAE